MILSSAISVSSTPAMLTRLTNGEYTASSVLAAPVQAVRLDLVRETDGNYGIDKVKQNGAKFDGAGIGAFNTPARISSGLLGALSLLQLGG